MRTRRERGVSKLEFRTPNQGRAAHRKLRSKPRWNKAFSSQSQSSQSTPKVLFADVGDTNIFHNEHDILAKATKVADKMTKAQTYLGKGLVHRQNQWVYIMGAPFANYRPSYSSAPSPSSAPPKPDQQPASTEQTRSARKILDRKQ